MGDEAFRELSAMDPKGNDLLDKVIAAQLSSVKHAKGAPFLPFLFVSLSILGHG